MHSTAPSSPSISSSSCIPDQGISLSLAMEQQTQETMSSKGSAIEPVRTRWSPKPEQILILESIFNSGMVNPPKEETVKIRKLLENFGPVGDANVFYWFQNRRSRSRRRQRQIQAAMAGTTRPGGSGISHNALSSTASFPIPSTSFFSSGIVSPSETVASVEATSRSSVLHPVVGEGVFFPVSRFMDAPESVDECPIYSPPCASTSHCQSLMARAAGFMTVFINGIPQEVPRGPFDLGEIFGQDVMLVHSSGELIPLTNHGILLQDLQAGESYFLVPRQA